MNFKTQKMASIEMVDFDKKVYEINEKLPNLNWNLQHKETLKIGGYLCNKATLYFRGRNYIAWYAKKLPVFYGPWKFHGLPGLIFKIYDENLTYDWTIKKIGNKTIDEDFLNSEKHHKSMNIKDFVKFKYDLYSDKIQKLEKNITTRQERGTKVIFTPGRMRKGQEQIYEWEEETKKN